MTNEMIEALFSQEVFDKAKKLSLSNRKTEILDRSGIIYRLLKAPVDNIVLEIKLSFNLQDYFKPIGYYDFDGDTEICFLYEFEENYLNIKYEIDYYLMQSARSLDLEYNVFAALASYEVGNIAKNIFSNKILKKHHNLLINNLTIEIKPSIQNTIEAIFIDTDGIFNEELLVLYEQKDDGFYVHCTDLPYRVMKDRGMLGLFNN